MRTAPEIRLSEEERKQLTGIISRGTSRARVQTRARILLMAADSGKRVNGKMQRKTNSNIHIAEVLNVSEATVLRTRRRYLEGGLEMALNERKRSGRPVDLDGATEAKLVMLMCSAPPEGRQRWTLQLLAGKMVELGYAKHISNTWVMKRLKKTNFGLG